MSHITKKIHKGWYVLVATSVVFVILIFITIGLLQTDSSKSNRILDGVLVGGVSVGGLTREEALIKLENAIEKHDEVGVIFSAFDTTVRVTPNVISDTPDASYFLYHYNSEQAIMDAYSVGRQKSLFDRVATTMRARRNGIDVPLLLEVNREALKLTLAHQFDRLVTPPKETSLKIATNAEPFIIEVVPGASGHILHYDRAIEEMVQQLSVLKSGPVRIGVSIVAPTVSEAKAAEMIPNVEHLLATSTLAFTLESHTPYLVTRAQFAPWIGFNAKRGAVNLAINKEPVEDFLKILEKEVNVEPVNPKFEMVDGKVKEFEIPKSGIKIDREATIANITSQFIELGNSVISLSVVEVPPIISSNEFSTYGIKEIVAMGKTDLGNSPKNRRHNIAVGVAKMNGTLIAPGEEFSALKTLGLVDGEHGFLEELVIKENVTKPEFGGGLCQVSTTLFRATLNAGLPVTSRRNHSYRVPYYEPPVGKDATIYDPAPDYRFINDTAHYLLLQGRVEGNGVVFEFWGTKDNRSQTQTDPILYNILPPPPKKMVITDTLPPGKVKCTERAHAGGTADFTYTITYPSGEVKEQKFHSVYKPWGEVCVRGAEPGEPLGLVGAIGTTSSTPVGNPSEPSFPAN